VDILGGSVDITGIRYAGHPDLIEELAMALTCIVTKVVIVP
jgi:hypothetical protein